jgi:hypothetical protein
MMVLTETVANLKVSSKADPTLNPSGTGADPTLNPSGNDMAVIAV